MRNPPVWVPWGVGTALLLTLLLLVRIDSGSLLLPSSPPGSNPHRPREQNASASTRLVVFNALGRPALIPIILHNLEHFAGWDCIVKTYLTQVALPDNDTALVALGRRCKVQRHPGFGWGQLLHTLNPTVLAAYDFLAVVLDDVFLPSSGPTPLCVECLVRSLSSHHLDVVSPVVLGAHMHALNTTVVYRNRNGGLTHTVDTGLYEVEVVEFFATFFTRDAWAAMWAIVHKENKRNPGGWGYATCFRRYNPKRLRTLGVDHAMVAYHLEEAKPPPVAVPPGLLELLMSPGRLRKTGNPKPKSYKKTRRPWYARCAAGDRRAFGRPFLK